MGQRRRRLGNPATCGTSMRPSGGPLASGAAEAADPWHLRSGILAAFGAIVRYSPLCRELIAWRLEDVVFHGAAHRPLVLHLVPSGRDERSCPFSSPVPFTDQPPWSPALKRPLGLKVAATAMPPAQDRSASGGWLGGNVGKPPLPQDACAGHTHYSVKMPIILPSLLEPCARG